MSWVINRSAASRLVAGVILSGSRFRKSVSRMSRSMSLALMTCVPAMTAMRSRTTSPESGIKKTTKARRPRILKRLSDRKEELEMTYVLGRRRAVARQLRNRLVWIAGQQLGRGDGESEVVGRSDAISEVRVDGARRRAIANSETDGLYHVVEVRRI